MRKLLLFSLITLSIQKINAQCLPAINNETISVSQSTICSGTTSTITIGSSLPGIKYSLRDDATNAVVAGPTNGTGAALSFNTGALTSSKTFNVYAETQPGGNVALDFDGSNDIINTNTFSSSTSSLTLEAWIFPRATAYRRILSNYYQFNQNDLGQFTFDTYNPNNNGRGLRFVAVGGTGTTFSVTASNVLTLNSWNHVAGVFANGVMKLYVNGLAVATSTAPFTTLPANSNEITIGMDPYNFAVASFFDGKIDDIRIWNSARTATEISNNMNNCLVGNEVGLKNYFKLFENSGIKTLDIVTNAIGTMSGMTASTAWTSGNVDCGTTTCNFEMTNLKTVTVVPNPTITVNSGSICTGNSFTIAPSGASTYTIQGVSAIKTPTANASYTVAGTSIDGCISSTFATSSVTVIPNPTITVNSGTICSGNSFTITPSGANTYTIQGGGAIKTPTANTSYTVVGTSLAGCVSSTIATSNVTVNPLPNINVSFGLPSNPLCVGHTATLTANGNSTSYLWNTGDAVNTITVSPAVTTNYTVTGLGSNGCSNYASVNLVVSNCVGINELTNSANKMSIYPNPSSSILTIQTIEEIKAVYIFNTLGDLVQTEKTNTFSVEQLSSGIYMIQVKTEKGINTLRFIRE